MKKILSVLAVLCLLAVACPAAADDYYPVTTAFMNRVSRSNGFVDYLGRSNEDGADILAMPYEDFSIMVVFLADGNHAELRVYDVIAFDEAQRPDVLDMLNSLNASYKYITFHADNDNTVTATMDVVLAGANLDASAEITFECSQRMAGILHDAWDTLQALNAAAPAPTETPAPAPGQLAPGDGKGGGR